jgi:hypothetical protein
MNQIKAGILLCSMLLATTSALASPFYIGAQADNSAGGILLGYQLDKTFTLEARYRKSEELISHSGVTSDTSISAAGLSVLALFPLKMTGGSSYLIFAKAGYERRNIDETYTFPTSVTYNGTVNNVENRTIIGTGVQYEFYQHVSGRAGFESMGDQRSLYLAVLFTF